MFKKVRLLSIFLVILSLVFLVACGSNSASSNKTTPKELVTEALKKSLDMDSYAFSGQMALSIDLDESLIAGPDEQMVASLFKDLKLDYRGVYQADIEQMELIVETNLNLGDLKTLLEIPILMKQDKMWIKIPAIPGIVPEQFAGQQLQLDFRQLAEMSGEEYISFFDRDNPQYQEQLAFIKEIMDIFFKHLDDELFTLTSSEGESVVTLDIGGERFHAVVETLLTTTLTELIQLFEEEARVIGLSEEDVVELKELKNNVPEEMDQVMEELRKSLAVNKGEFIFHINKDRFVTKQEINFDLTFTDPESVEEFSMAIAAYQETTKINEPQEFTLEEPTEHILDVANLLGMFMPYDLGGELSSEFTAEFDEEWDMDLEAMDQLLFALMEAEWFHDPQIQELFFTDPEFQEALYDKEVLEQLLHDPAFRKNFFSQFGVEVDR